MAGQTVKLEYEVDWLSAGWSRLDSDVQLTSVCVGSGRINEFVSCLATTHEHLSQLRTASQLSINHTHVRAAALTRHTSQQHSDKVMP